jgi:SAM-dependent methyltransferase
VVERTRALESLVVSAPTCRFCRAPLRVTFADLGLSPLANSYVEPLDVAKPEAFFPLHARTCEACFLVQLEEFETRESIFGDYAYFSSFSTTWIDHAQAFISDAIARFKLDAASLIVEIASNDGYLLQWAMQAGISVVGIEPARNVAAVAIEKGIPTRIEFFGVEAARRLVAEGFAADLLVCNNVLAHVPDINDFVGGVAVALKSGGRASFEFPHLLRLIAEQQFDTIYHEHFSYLSLTTVRRIFSAHGLEVIDVAELPTHGGSLRVTAARNGVHPVSMRVAAMAQREEDAGLTQIATYTAFGRKVDATKRALLQFLIDRKAAGKRIAAYGAPAKGNTLLNYCGIRTDFVDFTVDRSPHKQGRFLPGTRIPIHPVERLFEERPDYVLILPWNLRDEIVEQMAEIRSWGGRFVVPIPEVRVYP